MYREYPFRQACFLGNASVPSVMWHVIHSEWDSKRIWSNIYLFRSNTCSQGCTQGSFHYSPGASGKPWHQASSTFLTLIWTFSLSSAQDSLLSRASFLRSPDDSGQGFRHGLPYDHRLHIIALNPINWKIRSLYMPLHFLARFSKHDLRV